MKFFWLLFILFLLLQFKFLNNYVHMMNLLIILESMMMMNFFLVVFLIQSGGLNSLGFLFLFLVNVMEACVGLGMLIFLSRNVGEEYKFIL